MANSYGRKIYYNLSQIERCVRNLSDLVPHDMVLDFFNDYITEYYAKYEDDEALLFWLLSHNGSIDGLTDGKDTD